MKNHYIQSISVTTSISYNQVVKTIGLLEEGATIPFISRYRKEVTGSLDEVQVGNIKEKVDFFKTLESRKETVIKSLEEQGFLTSDLRKKIEEIISSVELEDLYLPFKPKRKTKASIAKEKGLEPLAKIIYTQSQIDIKNVAKQYINPECDSLDLVFQGARDIIAEWLSENSLLRTIVRNAFKNNAIIASKLIKGKEVEAEKYEQYFDFSELLKKSPSHRLLAIMRANKEGLLRVSISIDDEDVMPVLKKRVLTGYSESSNQVYIALQDCYKRLIQPSIETEFYNEAKERADVEAIQVFSENLRQLLMLPPLGQKRTLAIDPGFRTGCKVVCLNEFGDLLHNETIYPHSPQQETVKSMKKITQLVSSYKIEAIAIGNGTASRETENFIKKVAFPHEIQVYIINEAGASIYSASKIAREEFPEYDVTVRGSVSIGRRLMDPLAELVKIDPKSIGVGQYQHDVNQTELQKSLDRVVESCVNKVGVELNTASKHLLAYVAGVGPVLAENIISYRKQNGAFTSRKELLSVPKMGKKSFEQCAGFLRISNAENSLDNSAVHPERYKLVEKMAKDVHATLDELIKDSTKRNQIDIKSYVSEEIGLPTLEDILQELERPGRDPRAKLKKFTFDESISKIGDLSEGKILPGIVTNITNFGAFVDIGLKQNGLVHISQIVDKYISNPAEVLTINQHVVVKVVSVDLDKQRIQLSMKGLN